MLSANLLMVIQTEVISMFRQVIKVENLWKKYISTYQIFF